MQNLLVREDDLGVLDVDDARIPADVRATFASYDTAVATVVPVLSMSREEWWLFAADGTMIDMLCRRAAATQPGIRDSAAWKIVHRAIQGSHP